MIFAHVLVRWCSQIALVGKCDASLAVEHAGAAGAVFVVHGGVHGVGPYLRIQILNILCVSGT